MRASKVLFASGVIVFAIFFLQAFVRLGNTDDAAGPIVLGTFQLLGAFASLHLLSGAGISNASKSDWTACALAVMAACVGPAAFSITIFALYLVVRRPSDLNVMAAGTVATAVAVQALWAPMVFAKLSFLFLQIDAGIVGWLMSLIIPGASWSGTLVSTPGGHAVIINEPCASFHNLSLASLCWVTLTMMHRPYWLKSDIYIGLGAALIQFGFNIWRLTFVCFSLPMYEFWHDGFGRHIFSAIATGSAIVFVQAFLVLRDRRDQQKLELATN